LRVLLVLVELEERGDDETQAGQDREVLNDRRDSRGIRLQGVDDVLDGGNIGRAGEDEGLVYKRVGANGPGRDQMEGVEERLGQGLALGSADREEHQQRGDDTG
jgi:hypothetical protein